MFHFLKKTPDLFDKKFPKSFDNPKIMRNFAPQNDKNVDGGIAQLVRASDS